MQPNKMTVPSRWKCRGAKNINIMKTTHTKVKCCKETIYGLTFGKIYDVIEENFMFIKIVDDNGKITWASKDNFWDASN